MRERRIEVKKSKIFGALIGSLFFVSISIWILSASENAENEFFRSVFAEIIAYSGLMFFGLVGIIALIQLFSKKSALIINEKGITDNTTMVSLGFIPWAEIQQIQTTNAMNQRFLMIILKDPKRIIARSKNPWQKMFNKLNYRLYGSPVGISINNLKISAEELKQELKAWSEMNSSEKL
ncbi:STM3941 family protein [Ornithobacterium rhinotracheale]|uniref:STM3941 family protein n=1 Tax=Ornithobacterium rhinotracheale TaxID=28251 RepID=UPI003FA46A6C